MLVVVSFILVLGWAWRSPLVLIGMGLRAIDRWTSRLRTNVSFPVPNEDDDDYLETRSYA
jgi:hypothetical protein